MFVPDSENFVRVFPYFFTGCPKFCGPLFDHTVALFRGICIENRHTRLYDPCFFKCNSCKGVTEDRRMVQTD